jgi:cytochrome c-type biogenesis protein
MRSGVAKAGVLVLAATLVAGAWLFIESRDRHDVVPDFTVRTLDNETFTMSEQVDRVVVLQFMATWCSTCKITDAEIKSVWPAWNDSAVVVLSLDVDPLGSEEELRQYRDQNELPWAMARDTAGVGQAYGVWELGRLLVIDQAQRVAYDKKGVAEAGTVDAAVRQAIEGKASSVGLPSLGLLPLAVLAGFATFFSPCAASLLPAYVTMNMAQAGTPADSMAEFRGRLRRGATASLGLLIVLAGAGLFLFGLGTLARAAIPRLQPVVGLAMVILGVASLIRPQIFAWATRSTALVPGAARADTGGGPRNFWYGVAYGGAASGCVLPVVLQLGAAAALAGPVLGGSALLAYAATASLLMIAFASASAFLPEGAVRVLLKWGRFLPILAGAVFILAGLYLVYFYWRAYGVAL